MCISRGYFGNPLFFYSVYYIIVNGGDIFD